MPYDIHLLAGRVDRAAGSHAYHLELSRRLAARGHRVTVVCFGALPVVRDWARVYETPLRPYHEARLLWRFGAWLRYRDVSRAMASTPCPAADLAICGEHLLLKAYKARFPATPLIYFPHALLVDLEFAGPGSSRIERALSRGLYSHLQRWALRHADCTVRFTEKACRVLAESYGLREGPRFVVNPPGIDPPPQVSRTGPVDGVRLLTVGRLIASKGIELALSALRDLHHLRWRYDIVGDGEARAALEGMAVEYGLGDRVQFHGHRTDPDEWYRRADLFLFPSRFESFGLVLIEAMAFGVPCLAVRSDGSRYWNVCEEVIEHGRTGLLAEGEADFAGRLRSILEDPDRLLPLGPAARQHVLETYTWDRHLDRYEELFEGLVSARDRGISGDGQPEPRGRTATGTVR